MSLPIIPWEPCNFPDLIQAELNRRKKNRGLNYIKSEKGSWSSDTGDWQKYMGPMSSWVRLCSNGNGNPKSPKPGFVFFSGQDFYSGYGFKPTSDGKKETILGFMPDGRPHVLEYGLKTSQGPIHVPPPELEKVSAVIQKELFRRVTIDWICFSPEQLEYMTPYFLTAGISCIIEWGWNHFEQSTLLNLNDLATLGKYLENPYPLYNQHILKSRGNYDVLIGKVTGWNWSLDGSKIRCTTEITSKDRIYAGIPIDSTTISEGADSDAAQPLGTLRDFFKAATTQFKGIRDFPKHPVAIAGSDPFNAIRPFLDYIKRKPNYEETLYGVYYGRDVEDQKAFKETPAEGDWDKSVSGDNVWLNMGLVMEIVNYHSSQLRSPRGNQMFQFDISDVVISAHPNLISSDGTVLLIPNAEAPKYSYGTYGDRDTFENPDPDISDYSKYPLEASTHPGVDVRVKADAKKAGLMADYRLRKICSQPGGKAFRDDLDMVINDLRYRMTNPKDPCEFPFYKKTPKVQEKAGKPYPSRYSGYLKNLYVNVTFLQRVAKSETTIINFVQKVLDGINEAAGNFWEFHIVNGTGKMNDDGIASQKIIDYRFIATQNPGTLFSFDYYSSESLLIKGSFKPTLSNAVAIRSMYAQHSLRSENSQDKGTTFSSDTEFLDPIYTDRLYDGKENIEKPPKMRSSTVWIKQMQTLQSATPPKDDEVFQVTSKKGEERRIVKRLVLPYSSIVKMLLDDGDADYNPKYTGIMPGIQAQFTIEGIGGLRTFMMFSVRNLPRPYSHKDVIFRIVDLQEELDANGRWFTTITAGVIPLRKHIKERLGLK